MIGPNVGRVKDPVAMCANFMKCLQDYDLRVTATRLGANSTNRAQIVTVQS